MKAGDISDPCSECGKPRVKRRCRECETMFYVTDNRQQFCPPEEDQADSRCAMRWHKRDYRRRVLQKASGMETVPDQAREGKHGADS